MLNIFVWYVTLCMSVGLWSYITLYITYMEVNRFHILLKATVTHLTKPRTHPQCVYVWTDMKIQQTNKQASKNSNNKQQINKAKENKRFLSYFLRVLSTFPALPSALTLRLISFVAKTKEFNRQLQKQSRLPSPSPFRRAYLVSPTAQEHLVK